MKSNRILITIFSLMVIASMALAACGGGAATGGKTKVGLSFSDFATERWKNENDLMTKLLQDKGYEVVSAEANHDVKLQNDQIDNMVSQGVKGLIVIAEDGDAAVTSVDKAADAGVKVLAYDRLIKTSKIAAYLSFDNVEVGRQQGLGVMKALGVDDGKWTKENPAKVVMLGGSPTDNNATLFRKGQMEAVQPYVDSGVVTIVADQWVDNWDAANALKIMENILTAQNNEIDAVVASNDGTALGALQAMKAQGLAGKVPISGQDATADGCNSIVKGELTVSILKDIRNLSPLAVDVMDKLLNGQAVDGMKNFTLAELTVDDTKQGEVPCVFLEVQQVNKDNVFDLVVKSEFQSYDDVYRDIPEDQRPSMSGEAPAAPAAGKKEYSDMTLCYPQLGAESDWRTANTASIKETAEQLGAKLIFSDAQQKQENQISAMRACIQQGVDVIALPPVVEDGWDAVLQEAQDAGIPVIIVDRSVSADKSLYASHIGSDMELEGKKSGEEMNKLLPDGGNVLEISGTTGSGAAVGRAKGFRETLNSNITILDSQTGNFNPTEAKPVAEAFLKKYAGQIDGFFIHNDGMAQAVVEALKAAGVKPGEIKIVSVDGTRGGFQMMIDGWVQADVECNPLLGPQVFEMALKLVNGEAIDPEVLTNETVYYPDNAAELLPTRKY